jgi:uncharacterized Ntn-hydrolase superfamily protein
LIVVREAVGALEAVVDSVSVVVGTVGISVVSVVAEEVGGVVALADLAAGSAEGFGGRSSAECWVVTSVEGQGSNFAKKVDSRVRHQPDSDAAARKQLIT